ncbi:MAG TPA: ABC transporter permease [Acidimicrobiia bacterium]|nr:ABC transporter permease [Acidimicrobiia bacterium]
MTLGSFARRRVLQALVTLLALTLVVHAGISLIPGDPVRALFGFVPPSPAELAELRARYGLDQAYPVQYLSYLTQLVQGNLGVTISFTPQPVSTVVGASLPTTAILIGVGLLLQLTTAYGVTVLSMFRRSRLVSALTWWVAVAATAAPVIFTAWALRSFFTLGYQGLDWFPYPFDGTPDAYVLPLIALVAMLAGPVVLLFRSELLDTLRSTFTRFAVASGHSELRIVAVHAAKASAGPVIAYLGASLGYLLTGVVIVESVYDIPGVGNLILDSVARRDRAVVVGGVLIISVFAILGGMVADIVAAAVDPRIRLEGDAPR